MNPVAAPSSQGNLTAIKALTYMMFMMFAMTTDSVGGIIPQIIKEFKLSMTVAGAFQYATMSGIALAAFFLGYLADKFGRKATIVIGLVIFAADSYLFVVGRSFAFFLVLLAISGLAIGVFKTGALALIGDISRSTKEHTAIMNTVEGFFGVGSIVGPLLLAYLITAGVPWQWLYAIAGTLCLLLVAISALVKYPATAGTTDSVDLSRTMRAMRDPFALLFSLGAFLYVATECAVYVWGPTLLAGYRGPTAWLATYSLTAFFTLRACGRFLGAWLLERFSWTTVLVLSSGAILACFAGAMAGGITASVYLLPFSGLFMSVIYPTINSKGISCFPKSEHGAVAGVILFFTCVSAAAGPLAQGWVSDKYGDVRYGFALATGFAALLFVLTLLNHIYNPTKYLLSKLDRSEYHTEG
jgi:MFS transporter, FHS family, L-fucose permease